MSCIEERTHDCSCEKVFDECKELDASSWKEGCNGSCNRNFDKLSISDSTDNNSESSTSLDILTNGADLCRTHKPVFQHQKSLQACQAEKNLLKTSTNYRVGKNQGQYKLEKQNVFKKKQRKPSIICVYSPQSNCKKLSKPRVFHQSESPSDLDLGSGDHNRTNKQLNQTQTLYPAFIDSLKTNVDKQPKETFPFKSTASGNFKLTPNQVVYESKNLSIVAADPEMVSMNITDEPSIEELAGLQQPSKKADNENWTTTCLFTTVDTQGNVPFGSESTFSESDGAELPPLGKPSELSLARMGYVTDNCIDWDHFNLPQKTDLQKVLLQNILNRVNPDIQIKIGNSVYKCHKIVLQCYCSYFNASPGPVVELPETEVSKDVFYMLYQWMLHISTDSYRLLKRDNILDVFKAARFLGIKELEDQCWAFMDNVEIFSEDKAFLLYLDARKQGNKDLMELMIPRIQRFFLTLVSSKEFVELPLEEVCTFLKSNYICIHSEMEVFMAAVRWLSHDWPQRKPHAVEVMKNVRFGFINPQILITIRRNPQSPEFQRIANIPEVSQMIDDGVALVIAKFYYENESDEDFKKNLKSLGLEVPIPRNWSGTDKNYCSYQDFLKDLSHYRSKQRLEKRKSKIKLEMDRVNIDEFLSSAVLPPDSQKKLQKLRGGKHSSLLRCLPQMEPKEVDLLKKLICKDDSTTTDNSQEMKRHFSSVTEENSQLDKTSYNTGEDKETKRWKNDRTTSFNEEDTVARTMQKAYGTRSRQGREPFKEREDKETKHSKLDKYSRSREEDAAARTIQQAYRTYSRRMIKSSIETTKSQMKMKLVKKTQSDPSFPAALLRSSTHPVGKCDEHGLPLEQSKESVFLFGGANPFDFDSNKNSQRIFQYQTKSNFWRQCGYMPEPLFYHSALYFLGKIYIAGGKNPGKLMKERDVISRKVWRYEPEQKRWVSLSNMIHARRSFVLVACNNKIFAIGGRDEKDRILSSVEMYDVNSNQWEEVRPLHQARCGAAACELNSRIWVAGGIINHENVATTSVEYYHFEHNMWIQSANLRFTFAYSVLLPVKGKMYLIGGTIGLKDHAVTGSGKQIDVWDADNQTWNLTSMMSKPRHGHAAVYLKGLSGSGQVLIMGGMSTKHKSVMQNTECWRLEDDHWVLGVAPIPYPASGMAALALPSETFT